MDLLVSISSINPWAFFVLALTLLAISAIVDELTIIPWLCLAITCVGVADYFSFSVINQLAVFSVTLLASIYISRRYSSKTSTESFISESINDLVLQSVNVCEVNVENSANGRAISSSGKKWKVEHKKNKPLVINEKYICVEVIGITLKIEG